MLLTQRRTSGGEGARARGEGVRQESIEFGIAHRSLQPFHPHHLRPARAIMVSIRAPETTILVQSELRTQFCAFDFGVVPCFPHTPS
eukprot:1160968-Rhodomonas_salina.2